VLSDINERLNSGFDGRYEWTVSAEAKICLTTHTHTHTSHIVPLVFHLWCLSERSWVWVADRNSKLTAAHLCVCVCVWQLFSTLRVVVVVQRRCVWVNYELQLLFIMDQFWATDVLIMIQNLNRVCFESVSVINQLLLCRTIICLCVHD